MNARRIRCLACASLIGSGALALAGCTATGTSVADNTDIYSDGVGYQAPSQFAAVATHSDTTSEVASPYAETALSLADATGEPGAERAD